MNYVIFLKKAISFLLFTVLFFSSVLHAITDTTETKFPDFQKINIKTDANRQQVFFTAQEAEDFALEIEVNGQVDTFLFINNMAPLSIDLTRRGELFLIKLPGEFSTLQIYHLSLNRQSEVRIRKIPLWLSLFPPLLAIGLALVFREVIIALTMGVLSGAFIASGMYFDSLITAFLRTADTYIMGALHDTYHLSIILLSLLIGSMVAIISNNGGMQGVINKIIGFAKDRRSTKLTGYFMGLLLFFDDYANSLIVGSAMRKLTDAYKISREKLAYIVDSTAAPIAAVALITTWVGAELSYIQSGIIDIDLELGQSVYAIFLASLKYSFYPFMTLVFVFMIIWSKKDFGPMYSAELKSLNSAKRDGKEEEITKDEELDPKKGIPYRWYNGVVPILTMIFASILGLVYTGLYELHLDALNLGHAEGLFSWGSAWQAAGLMLPEASSSLQKLGLVIGYSDPFNSLLWASALAVTVALFMTFYQNLLTVPEGMNSFGRGMKSMLPAITILVLAWGLALITRDLGTADYLAGQLEGNISPFLLPPIIFLIAAFTAFSTGSSWSTMAILYPIAIPATYAVCISAGLDTDITIELILNVISIVLAASVVGDHCSPLSDTTILSSLATGCDHIEHVRTQLPYALTVGAFALVASFLSTFFGGGWFVSINIFLIGGVVLWLIIFRVGKDPEMAASKSG
ncbi:MAG: Na+/H+ antiporter NhaC family protein [Saprospirales bacterium]|nr:MAG: Na+/H+ antiporter NhaC family protein [Saprospirales bacterium]